MKENDSFWRFSRSLAHVGVDKNAPLLKEKLEVKGDFLIPRSEMGLIGFCTNECMCHYLCLMKKKEPEKRTDSV